MKKNHFRITMMLAFFVMLMAFPFTVQAAKTYVPIDDKYVSVGNKEVALNEYDLVYTQSGTEKSIHKKVLSAITDGQNVYYSVELDNHLMQWNPGTEKSKAVAKLPVYSGNPWIALHCGYGNNLFFSSSTDNTYRYSLSDAKSHLIMKGVYVKERYKNLLLLAPEQTFTGSGCCLFDMSTLGKTTVSKSQQGATFINGKIYYAETVLSGDAFQFTIKRYDPSTKKTSTLSSSFKGLYICEIKANTVTYYDTNSNERTMNYTAASSTPATIRLSKSKASVTVGLTCKLTAAVTGKSQKVTWKSSNKSIAVVNAKGVVTAKKAGTAIITATANGKKATCTVTVLKPTIKLNKTKATISENGKLTLKATITGKSKTAAWSTSNKKVAVVKNGVVTGKGAGTATITAKANGVTAKCTITVKKTETKVFDEKAMYQMIAKNHAVANYKYADFDGNGTKEMFATTVEDGSDLSGVYFVNSAGKMTLVVSNKTRNLGIHTLLSGGKNYYSTGGKGFYFVDYNWNGTMWGDRTLLFGVKNNKPYELKLSGALSGFYTDNGVYTVRHYMAEHHVFMRTRLIYNSAAQEFEYGEDIGEW